MTQSSISEAQIQLQTGQVASLDVLEVNSLNEQTVTINIMTQYIKNFIKPHKGFQTAIIHRGIPAAQAQKHLVVTYTLWENEDAYITHQQKASQGSYQTFKYRHIPLKSIFTYHPSLQEASLLNNLNSVIMLNVFDAKTQEDANLVETSLMWTVQQVISKHPGFLITNIHRSITPDSHTIVNYTQWQSPEVVARILRDPQVQASLIKIERRVKHIGTAFQIVQIIS